METTEKSKPNILYLDDEQNNLTAFQATFRRYYTIYTALTAAQAIEIIKTYPIEVILTDQRMPEMTGVKFLEKVREIDPYPIRIIMSAYTDVESIIQSINTGKVFYFITKPWNENDIKQILDGAIKIFQLDKKNRSLISQLREKQETLTDLNETLESRIAKRTKELEDAQQQLLYTAHLAGMSQVATNVIHNVGNILNTVNVSVETLLNKLKNSEYENLIKCIDMINEHIDDLSTYLIKDSKGSLLPEYIRNVSQVLQNQKEDFKSEMLFIHKNVQTINRIIAAQQSLTGHSGDEQSIGVQEIIEDTLKICSDDIIKNNIIIKRDYHDLTSVCINKIKLLQILINLLCNARDALIESSVKEKIISISLSTLGDNKFCIKISDNGIGITSENLKNIFTFGFTTKNMGHGFGLHSCLNSVLEMKGELKAESEGLNKGACFVLELPMNLNMATEETLAPHRSVETDNNTI
jgi:C4-dicarboxylate-specific signal transduction histidine kinase